MGNDSGCHSQPMLRGVQASGRYNPRMWFPSASVRLLSLASMASVAALCGACDDSPSPASSPSAPSSPPPVQAASMPASQPSTQPASTSLVASRVRAARDRLTASPAGKLVLRSIRHHGGLQAWFAQRAIAFTYDYVPVGDSNKRKTSHQVVDLLQSRAYHSMSAPAQGTFAFDGNEAWMKLTPPVPFPARFWSLTPYYFVGMPFVLSDDGVRLELTEHTGAAVGLPPCDVVAVTFAAGTGDAPDDTYFVYLDKQSGELLGLRYTVTYAAFFKPGANGRKPDKVVLYSDARQEGAFRLPRTHTTYMMRTEHASSTTAKAALGQKVTVSTVRDVEHGATFDEAQLLRPAGAVVDTSLSK